MRKKRTIGLALILIVAVGALVVDAVTAVRPRWPEAREGAPIPQRPDPDDSPFHQTPLAPTYEERQALFLAYVAEQETPESRGGIWTDIAKLAYDDATPISEAALRSAVDFVNAREDTADFVMAGLMRLYHQHADSGALTAEQVRAIEEAVLNFKYWLDEPSPTYMELWTENHQILAHSAEYLAGQLFPDRVFSNNGQTGRWHMEAARQRLLRWIDWHARTGMAEWDSVTYYRMDLAALMNLVDFAEDEEVSRRAAMMVDLLLFDIAVDSFYGQYGTSHGRATASGVKSAANDGVVTVQALVWGLGRFQSSDDMGAISLATSERYQIPPVIEAVGLDMPEAYTNRERHSIPVTEEAAAQYGLRFDNLDDIGIWWGMGAFTHPKVIDLTIRTADEWDLWHYPDFRPLKDLAGALQSLGLLSEATALLDPDPNGTLTSEVNKITYRTPDTMLSSAQDYRKGEKGYQQHIWQATLGPYAVVFVTNPDSLREDDKHRPSYWASQGRLPRTAQYQNLLIALYDIDRHPSPSILEARHYAFTHAYFPQWAFDEVREARNSDGGGWILGRKGDGYVALYSHQPYEWQTEGPDAGQEVIALGRRDVWLCQLGRRAVDGSFEDFVAAVTGAELEVRGLEITYQAPGIGEVTFDWDGPLRVDGREIPLGGYARWDNPYTQAEFGTGQFVIEHSGRRLELDFERGTREMDG
jgi:hypothetical protein